MSPLLDPGHHRHDTGFARLLARPQADHGAARRRRETPGFAVIDLRTRKLVRTIEPAQGEPKSDFHGIGVRILGR